MDFVGRTRLCILFYLQYSLAEPFLCCELSTTCLVFDYALRKEPARKEGILELLLPLLYFIQAALFRLCFYNPNHLL